MKLKDTKQLLNDLNLAPNKNLGQNFLINEEIAESITSLVKNQDYVIEIGPGLGALTKKLAQNNKKVLAIEIDRGFAEYLKKEAEKVNNITILHSDFLKYPLNKIKENINIVSNLPYNITTPIIEKVLLESNKLDKFVFMTQKDFIDRLLSKPGSKEYGPISVLISSLGNLEIFKVMNKENFYPQPKISSCVSVFVCKKAVSQNDRKAFYEFVKLLFKERRKTILNNLSAITKDKKEAERKLSIVKILPSRRPETLNIDEIQLLFDIMLNKTRKK